MSTSSLILMQSEHRLTSISLPLLNSSERRARRSYFYFSSKFSKWAPTHFSYGIVSVTSLPTQSHRSLLSERQSGSSLRLGQANVNCLDFSISNSLNYFISVRLLRFSSCCVILGPFFADTCRNIKPHPMTQNDIKTIKITDYDSH